MNKQDYIPSVISWAEAHGFDEIKANLPDDDFETPIGYERQQDDEAFVPDVTGRFTLYLIFSMSRTSFTLYSVAVFLTLACQPQNPAKTIINKSIAAHGGDAYQNKRISFDFRKYHLVLEQKAGQFRYERSYPDSTGAIIREVLTNDTFTRTLNNQPQTLDTAQIGKYSRAVNSAAYFLLLPNKLADPAVQPELVGESQIDGQKYNKVRVRFQADGGGKDHGDTFYYWFNQKTHTMDYLAYSDGGPRFRKAINPSVVGGIRFQDYINYKGDPTDTTSVGQYDQKYQAHQLEELSRIEQTNIRVEDLT